MFMVVIYSLLFLFIGKPRLSAVNRSTRSIGDESPKQVHVLYYVATRLSQLSQAPADNSASSQAANMYRNAHEIRAVAHPSLLRQQHARLHHCLEKGLFSLITLVCVHCAYRNELTSAGHYAERSSDSVEASLESGKKLHFHPLARNLCHPS